MLQALAVGTKVDGFYYGHPFSGVVSESRRTQTLQRVAAPGSGSAQRIVHGSFHEVVLTQPTNILGGVRELLWLSFADGEAAQHQHCLQAVSAAAAPNS